jgi:nucleotide-binding universal stress UspA family protein
MAINPQANGAPDKRVQMRRVLVPIDFSKSSLGALESALPLIHKFGAELHLVHVFEPDYPLASMAALPLIVPELTVAKRVRSDLQELAKKHSVPLRRENIHAIKGRPFEEICGLARDKEIDLIVLSTRGLTGLKHLVLGSTAERVVRYSPCPVLIVGRGGKWRKNAKSVVTFGKILVPIDFSECSMKGLVYAKALARQFGSKLILLNAVHPQYYITSDEYARFDLPLLMEEAEKASREQMAELVQRTDWEGIKVSTSLQVGHPGDQICQQAKELGADLIVTSTHGMTGLKHVLLGSTAEYVVRHANRPIFVVPAHDRPVPASSGKQP